MAVQIRRQIFSAVVQEQQAAVGINEQVARRLHEGSSQTLTTGPPHPGQPGTMLALAREEEETAKPIGGSFRLLLLIIAAVALAFWAGYSLTRPPARARSSITGEASGARTAAAPPLPAHDPRVGVPGVP
jgi:hypothetical protein